MSTGDKKTLAQRAKEYQERVRQENEAAKLTRREDYAQFKLDQQKKRQAAKEENERRKQEYQTQRAERSARDQAAKEERKQAYQADKQEREQAYQADKQEREQDYQTKCAEISASSQAFKQERVQAYQTDKEEREQASQAAKLEREQEYQTKRAEISASSQAAKEEREKVHQAKRAERAERKEAEIGTPSAAREQERPVAVFDRVALWEDRIELCKSWRPKDFGMPADIRPLAGVTARIDDERVGGEYAGRDYRDVFLTISGPGFEWAIRTDAVFSSRKARVFAAKVNAAGSTTVEPPPRAPSVAPSEDVISRLEKLVSLHQAGALTDEEFAAAKRRVLGG
jgi:hypothetical protein